jgi:hypothetical protein
LIGVSRSHQLPRWLCGRGVSGIAWRRRRLCHSPSPFQPIVRE